MAGPARGRGTPCTLDTGANMPAFTQLALQNISWYF